MTPYLTNKTLYPPQIVTPPSMQLNKVVVIPCYDEPQAIQSLNSLKNCQPPLGHTEVILVINQSAESPENVKEQNQQTYEQAMEWTQQHSSPSLQFHVLFLPDLPRKHAGVGLARKIGMDEAVYRLEQVGRKDGMIICYDADSNCLPNYLIEIEHHFKTNPKTQAASIHFEHPIQGTAYPETVYTSIIDYELHLRYYINALRFAGHPFAYQTIGSSMAVRCDAYQQQGGMNRKKAGEDFYFLHKFIPLGQFSEINTTMVIPSPRPSNRVPFGTGKAVQDRLNAYASGCTTYAPETFIELKQFLETVPDIYNRLQEGTELLLTDLPAIQQYFKEVDLTTQCASIFKNTANQQAFEKRFYRWFDAFKSLKYVHSARDAHYPDIPVGQAAKQLLIALGFDVDQKSTNTELLLYYRKIDKTNPYGQT